MMRHIVLDSSPLGLLTNPASNAEVIAINQWSFECIKAGYQIYIPEVIDYEHRRELVRAGKSKSIELLDSLKDIFFYLPITTSVMLQAADLWAHVRHHGLPTSDPTKLDIDVILCAQSLDLIVPADSLVVATSNVSHISRFVAAEFWSNIMP